MQKVITYSGRYAHHAPLVLRVGLGAVFVYFGFSALTQPETWINLLPEWLGSDFPKETFVQVHGLWEILLGALLIAGVRIWLVSGLLFLTLVVTIAHLSFGPTFVRDAGLAAALLSIFLHSSPKKPLVM